MRILGVTLLILHAALPASADLKKDQVEAVVSANQIEAISRFGWPIRVTYDALPEFSANGGLSNGTPEIRISAGFLERLEMDEIVFGVCHEIGHSLGTVTYEDSGAAVRADFLSSSVEGEADYFGGACAARYFGDEKRAIAAAKRLLEKMYSTDIDLAELPSLLETKGILDGYPPPVCRLESAARGAQGLARPSCWYHVRN